MKYYGNEVIVNRLDSTVVTVYGLDQLLKIRKSGDITHALLNLTFRGPCIVIYSYNKTNEMH